METFNKYVQRLNGQHVFVQGDHDPKGLRAKFIVQKRIESLYIVACHWAMRVWPRKHYGAVHIYGHSHGNLPPLDASYDVGVDNNNYYPISFGELLKKIIQITPREERNTNGES